MAEAKKSDQFRWRGMTLFTRGLLFFLAGTGFLFLRDQMTTPAAGRTLSLIAYGLFLIGFVIASLGMGHHWRDTVVKELEDRKKRNKETD